MALVDVYFGRSFAAQVKSARFESAGASALHTLPFDFSYGDARDKSSVGRGVLTTPPFIGQLSRSVGAQSTAQPWHTAPLLLIFTRQLAGVLPCVFEGRLAGYTALAFTSALQLYI